MSGFGGNSSGPTAVGDEVSTFVNAELWIFLTRRQHILWSVCGETTR